MRIQANIQLIVMSCALLFLTHFLTAQRIITNSTGEKIVMYPDGSWRMAEPGDSVLYQKQDAVLSSPLENLSGKAAFLPEDELLKQWNDLYFNIRAHEKKVQGEFRAATNAQFKANEQYSNAVNNPGESKERIRALKGEYKKSIARLKAAKTKQKAIERVAQEAKTIANLPQQTLQKKMTKLWLRFNKYLQTYEPHQSQPEPIMKDQHTVKSADPPGDKKDPVIPKQKSDTNNTALRLPPGNMSKPYRSEPFKCKFIIDTTDGVTGRRKLELAPSLLFTHTDPDLRPYFKEKELITCYGRFSKIDAYVYLTIDFQISSSHAQGNFGSLEQGSLLRLKLLDGEYVSLYNVKADRGRIDPYSGYTIFTGQYALGKNEIKTLMDSELDKVRILWSTGYEDYDVFKVNFFIDHLKCLEER